MKNKKVAVVLSGGGALGIAHLGVLEVLEQHNIPIDIITGTSMGALIGGLYSAGVSIEALRKKLLSFKRNHIVDIDMFALVKNGLLKGKKVVRYIENIVGNKKIEDCQKAFGCVATDLEKGEIVEITTGKLSNAIRSSIAVPGIFAPAQRLNKDLYDGGAEELITEDGKQILTKMKVGDIPGTFYVNIIKDLADTTGLETEIKPYKQPAYE